MSTGGCCGRCEDSYGVRGKLIMAKRSMYVEVKAAVRVNGTVSECF